MGPGFPFARQTHDNFATAGADLSSEWKHGAVRVIVRPDSEKHRYQPKQSQHSLLSPVDSANGYLSGDGSHALGAQFSKALREHLAERNHRPVSSAPLTPRSRPHIAWTGVGPRRYISHARRLCNPHRHCTVYGGGLRSLT